jgi:hypothetical protein
MASATNPRISIELVAGADPIRGSIERADGRRLPFWGWLELLEELRRLAEGESDGRPPVGPEPKAGSNAQTRPTDPAHRLDAGHGRRGRAT